MIKKLMSGADNETPDMGRVSWGLSFVALCALTGATVITGGTIGIVELAIALTTISAGHSAAIKLKESTEPKSGN